MKLLRTEVMRFLVAGAINTLVGYLLYVLALQLLPYRLAYTVAYALGVVVAYTLNTYFVFHTRWHWRSLMAFPLVYLLQYAVGLVALAVLVERLAVPAMVAPLLVVIITIPLTFVASRFVIKGRTP